MPEQLPMQFLTERDSAPADVWLGAVVGHRDLFDALETEWLFPGPSGGRAFAMRGFAAADDFANGRQFPVGVVVAPGQLPNVECAVFGGGGRWTTAESKRLTGREKGAFLRGALPMFGVTRLLVATSEERARLIGLAKQVSNIPLADIPVEVGALRPTTLPPIGAMDLDVGVQLPERFDRVRGAITMAVWAVPRIDPWVAILCASLGMDQSPLLAATEGVAAEWWRAPPWWNARGRARTVKAGVEWRLWQSALKILCGDVLNNAKQPPVLATAIAADAAMSARGEEKRAIQAWNAETSDVIRGDSAIDLRDWRAHPVGKALQLVLARPKPVVFKSWLEDLPGLPPGVWWSAATLCGLLNGYRNLETQFRGDRVQRRLVSVHAFRCCATDGEAERRWGPQSEAPTWRRQGETIVMSWHGEEFARKQENERGKWFVADIGRPEFRHAAELLSKRLGWPCIEREFDASDTELEVSSKSAPKVSGKGSNYRLKLRAAKVRIPANVSVRETLNVDEFRRCLATEGGVDIPAPPGDPVAANDHRGAAAHPIRDVPGLFFAEDFLTDAEERKLVETIDAAPWRDDLHRRVQHYGWRYDYKSRRVDAAMRIGPLPPWADLLARRLAHVGLLPHLADQVIVNEYVGKQGISKHSDCASCFADGIAMISLLQSWEMIFRNGRAGAKVPFLLEQRSVAVLTHEARYRWTHEIPSRTVEPSGLRRERRISITFRKVTPEREVSRGRTQGPPSGT